MCWTVTGKFLIFPYMNNFTTIIYIEKKNDTFK